MTTRRRTLSSVCLALVILGGSRASAAEETETGANKPHKTRGAGGVPVVGLALSGGGARGFAHIGVLKALEEMRIPVDRIAGTSMGAVIGGLYACGYKPAQIEEIILRLDWSELFRITGPRSRMALFEREESGRYLISLPMDRLKIKLPAGFSEGDRITSILALLTVNSVAVDSFDELPIPFRAVGTDLVTGERVALGAGSLPEAIRASLAFPFFFTPVEIEGRLLTDGGLSDNLPVDVAEEMGADIVIASDTTSPLRDKEELNSPLGIADQALSLEMVASAQRMRGRADAVIAPEIGKRQPNDFKDIPVIIAEGYRAARENPDLQRIARSVAPAPPRLSPKPPPILGGFRADGERRLTRRQLASLTQAVTGKPLSVPDLPQAIQESVGEEFFRTVRFQLEHGQDGKSLLVMKVSEKQTDRFNLSARADDKYGALGLVNLSFRNLWRGDNAAALDLQVGSFSRASAQFLTPSVPGTSFFFRPQAFWSNDFQLAYSDRLNTSRFVDRRWGFELQGGNTFRNLGAVTLGYRFVSHEFHLDTGMPLLAPFHGKVTSLALRSHVDTLDRSEVPEKGRIIDLSLESARQGLGGDLSFERASLDYAGYHTWAKRHTLVTGLIVGAALDPLPDFEKYRVGGVGYLTGLKREELRGDYAAGVRVGYRLRMADPEKSFLSRFYLEMGVDGANVWQKGNHPWDGGLIPDAYLSLLVRTWVGPFRLTTGFTEGGRRNATFFFGHSF
ncbi:MAG TPA: patatin-like phospholipase family protein [Candidatus Polarisedimenticolia bacterium]|nr:patatin-like phospholipase family protein [Candidatus Polarisedimenticolia bacterium]